MSPVRVRQCCDEEANGTCLTALELLVALGRARGVGKLGPLLCIGMATSDFPPCIKLHDAQELRDRVTEQDVKYTEVKAA